MGAFVCVSRAFQPRREKGVVWARWGMVKSRPAHAERCPLNPVAHGESTETTARPGHRIDRTIYLSPDVRNAITGAQAMTLISLSRFSARTARIGRQRYLTAALLLAAIKYVIDCSLAKLVFHRGWSPWDYLISGTTFNSLMAAPNNRAFYLAMAAVSVPFVAIGVWLTLARLRSAAARAVLPARVEPRPVFDPRGDPARAGGRCDGAARCAAGSARARG
jgi:hypothetical protein